MPTSLLEIIDLGDGDIVLQRADDAGEPLVTITFSDETRVYIQDHGLEVAKAMIQAGIQAAAQVAEHLHAEVEMESAAEQESDAEAGADRKSSRVLH